MAVVRLRLFAGAAHALAVCVTVAQAQEPHENSGQLNIAMELLHESLQCVRPPDETKWVNSYKSLGDADSLKLLVTRWGHQVDTKVKERTLQWTYSGRFADLKPDAAISEGPVPSVTLNCKYDEACIQVLDGKDTVQTCDGADNCNSETIDIAEQKSTSITIHACDIENATNLKIVFDLLTATRPGDEDLGQNTIQSESGQSLKCRGRLPEWPTIPTLCELEACPTCGTEAEKEETREFWRNNPDKI